MPIEIQEELNRRKINRSFNFIGNTTAGWNSSTGDWTSYRGPMVSWVRACSNGAGHPDEQGLFKNSRFVLYSGKGFYQTYGFAPPTSPAGSKYQVIGYTPGDENDSQGKPHIIENSLIKPTSEPTNYPIHVPPPEISRLECNVQKELYRRVQMEWVCFSWKQLVYMTPYFLVPGITCTIEWGWNFYNVESLIDLSDTDTMKDLWDNSYPLYTKNIIKSRGNYDVVFGIITNFNWSIEGNKIICSTEITSKDRLYAGIAKDYGLSVQVTKSTNTGTSSQDKTTKNGIFQSLKDFLSKDNTIKNLQALVTRKPVISSQNFQQILQSNEDDPTQKKWYDILSPLFTKGTPEQQSMRIPWVYGFFAGRQPDDADGNGSYTQNEKFGPPQTYDFDKKTQDKNDVSKTWINMGMVTTILNHFSALESGAKNGKNMFEVDIQNSIIGGYPNLISCDPRVLIPNYQAPKYLYGNVGFIDNCGSSRHPDPNSPYLNQTISQPINVGDSIPNQVLTQYFFQDIGSNSVCYRDNLDNIINYNRYRYIGNGISEIFSYSFPAQYDSGVLPPSVNNLSGSVIEKDYSGLLSNIYISYELLQDAVNNDFNASYVDIYNYILKVIMDSADGFWDLRLVDADGTLTITDVKYISEYNLNEGQQQERVYSFDYYDVDSIIKSLKFRPVLSDAQATRVIYGEVNNQDSKYKYYDKNDVLDYKFKDAVIGNVQDKEQGDSTSELSKRKSAYEELRDLVRIIQTLSSQNDDNTLQMSLNPNRLNGSGGDPNKPEIIKLCMPSQQLLRLLLNDTNEEFNSRYCAVQPGIILELTLQGIGGIRTFQYFIVRNLPEPYSEKNIVFRVTDVNQTVESGNWETTIRAQPLPLTAYVKKRLKGPITPDSGTPTDNGWPKLPNSNNSNNNTS